MTYKKELSEEGVVLIKNFWKNEEINCLVSDADHVIEQYDVLSVKADPLTDFNKLRRENKPVFNRRISERDGDEGMIDVWNFDYLVGDNTKKLINKVDKFTIDMIESSFGIKYIRKTVNLYINESVVKTRGIHADSHTFPSRIKCFIYLTSLDNIDYGPFAYIKKSHLKEGKKYHGKYDIINPLTEDDKNNYVVFDSVDIGDIVIAAVSGAHRGLPQTVGKKRIALVVSYDPVIL